MILFITLGGEIFTPVPTKNEELGHYTVNYSGLQSFIKTLFHSCHLKTLGTALFYYDGLMDKLAMSKLFHHYFFYVSSNFVGVVHQFIILKYPCKFVNVQSKRLCK